MSVESRFPVSSKWSGDLCLLYLLYHRSARVPLSAFIVEDMMEFVNAHATYRFVISDEEDERPRLLASTHPPEMFRCLTYTFGCRCGFSNLAFVLHTICLVSIACLDLALYMPPKCYLKSWVGLQRTSKSKRIVLETATFC